MIFRWCSWCPKYRGRRNLMGVAWEWRLRLLHTHGICLPCAMRVRIEAVAYRHGQRPALRVVK